MCKIKGRCKALDLPKTGYVLSIIRAISCFNKHVLIIIYAIIFSIYYTASYILKIYFEKTYNIPKQF